MRGIICGAILLALSLGLVGMIHELTSQLGAVSAVIILIAGAICFVLRPQIRLESQPEIRSKMGR
jgi:hypothetical protein